MRLKNFILKNKVLLLIMAAGLLLRLIFLFFGAEIYYGKKDFMVGGDTSSWLDSIKNLIDHGTYTFSFATPNGYFFRPPGYPFFIGFFYLLAGKNVLLAYHFISAAQIAMDVIAIFFFQQLALFVTNSVRTANLSSLLYAFYPFIIVWNPVVYAESSSVFFLVISLYYFFHPSCRLHYLWSGVFISISILIRLQTFFILPFLGLVLLIRFRNNIRALFIQGLQFFLAILLIYGAWPARNYINYHRVVFSQDLNVGGNWSPDYMAFMDYVFSIQTDHEPEYSQIIHRQKVQWPSAAYLVKSDSEKLAFVSALSGKCGTGFSHFMANAGLRNDVLTTDSLNCDSIIAKIYTELKASQIKNNPVHYYLQVPLSNLKKAIFKTDLLKQKSSVVALATSALFFYRTFLIFLGLIGIYFGFRNRSLGRQFFFVALGFFVLWYFYLSFVYRNMEIRYLLQCDLLLLIPAAMILVQLAEKYKLLRKESA